MRRCRRRPADDLQTVGPRHHDVEDEERRPYVPHLAQRLFAVKGGLHAIAGASQVQGHELDDVLLIVGDKYDRRCVFLKHHVYILTGATTWRINQTIPSAAPL